MWNRGLLLLGFSILAFVQVIAGLSRHNQHHHHRHQHQHQHQHSHQSAVQDTDGNELQAETPYYIVSAIREGGGGGGGVSVGRRESSTSSQSHTTHTPTVKQSSYDRNMGNPVIFSPALSLEHPELELKATEEERTTTIRESIDMNIGFSGMDTRVWQVEDRKEQSRGSSSSSSLSSRYVTLKGKPGHPGESTVRNWFRIERISENSPVYRIAYCPNVCESSCHVVCGRVGITKDNGERWLSVSENREFPLVFVRARHSNKKDE